MVGDSFGQLQSFRSRRAEQLISDYFRGIDTGRAIANDEERLAIADASARRQDRAYFTGLENQRYDRNLNAENQKYFRGFKEREFDAQRADAAANQSWHAGNLAVNQGKLGAGELADTLALAEEEAANGLFDPAKYASVLSPIRIQQLTAASTRMRRPIEENYLFFKNAAGEKNTDAQLAREQASLEDFKKTAPTESGNAWRRRGGVALGMAYPVADAAKFFMGETAGPTQEEVQPQIDTLNLERANIRKSLEGKALQRNLETGLTKDPNTGQWRPVNSLPWDEGYFAPPKAVAPVTTTAPSFGGFREGQIIYRKGIPYRVTNGKPVLMATQ